MLYINPSYVNKLFSIFINVSFKKLSSIFERDKIFDESNLFS